MAANDYRFMLAWEGQDGFVFSKLPMVIESIDDEHTTLKHIKDNHCSRILSFAKHKIKYHLMAFPKTLKYIELQRQLIVRRRCDTIELVTNPPFFYITTIDFTIHPFAISENKRVTEQHDAFSLSLYLNIIKDEDGRSHQIFVDTPEIVFKTDILNEILSTIEIY